jgi:intracellular septation protein A
VVLRHVLPRVVEATLIPTAIFYTVWHFAGIWPALLSAIGWAVALIARRLVTRRPVPGLLVIALLGLITRTVFVLWTGSTFVYFLQPVIGTTVVALTFVGSVVVGRPIVNRLAADFCPLSEEAANRTGVLRLFRQLTLFWAAVLMSHAVVTLILLLTVSVNTFVTIKSMSGPGLTGAAVLATVIWSAKVARREGLMVARVRVAQR